MAAVKATATEAVTDRSDTEDPAAAAAAAMPEPEAVKAGQGVEFKQRWWARDGWLIVDTRPPGMPAGQQRGADRLLAALAQTVCGERQPTVAHNIDWPLFVNRSIKHDVEEARFYLQQKWQSAEREGKIRYLLMLGDATPELLNCEPPDGFAADMGGWEAGDLACFVGPALSELMHLPAQKRKFWHRLQPWLDSLP
ncbi:hypothetical protein E4656_11245 [Natronospirillum operosum]|uniref:Uncharacterized protein n=1 Tax=Natronospirillum operosum TaxID=2759953 RepID=A0A4Z0W7K3_9GAMM|nr:hypothetical protein [Natronospirillum operosum]TGG92707.1 hypothetical protein E4656_11245 [Natronospirillum operosum]